MNDGEYWSEYDKFNVENISSLEVGEDGFKILQITDLHYHLPHKTKETDNIVKQLVNENKPDMIVITGDSVFGPTNMAYTKHVAKLMDSVTPYKGKKEYGSFTPSQVSWYSWVCDGLKENGYDNSMMFFHIAFPEYLDAYEYWKNSDFDSNIGAGEKREDVCSAPYNPGMFTKIKEKGHSGYVFVGHDHVNNYSVQYQGIRLSYGMKSSRQFYCDGDMIGGTVININTDKEVSIEHKYIDFAK